MPNVDEDHNEASAPSTATGNIILGVQIFFLILLFLACIYTPWIVTARWGHRWGLGTSVGAFCLWAVLGPRPFPGFIPGVMGVTVLLSNVICALISIVFLLDGGFHHH